MHKIKVEGDHIVEAYIFSGEYDAQVVYFNGLAWKRTFARADGSEIGWRETMGGPSWDVFSYLDSNECEWAYYKFDKQKKERNYKVQMGRPLGYPYASVFFDIVSDNQ
jgi:hypothetical protein